MNFMIIYADFADVHWAKWNNNPFYIKGSLYALSLKFVLIGLYNSSD